MSSTAGQPGTSNYGAPPQQYGWSNARNGMGTAALVLGILAVVTSWTVIGGIVLGLLAVIFGFIGRGRMKRGEATNGGASLAGLILGFIGLALAVVLIAVGATFVFHHKKAINNLESCLNQATTQSQRTSCNQQFSNSLNGNG
jgi:Domain of unknown function (DUF4190)